jgi:hypothetical protein
LSEALLIVVDRLRCGFGQFELGAHFLQAYSKRFNFAFAVWRSSLLVPPFSDVLLGTR